MLGADGYARVVASIENTASSAVYYFLCANASCSAKTQTNLNIAGATKEVASIALGSDDLPRISVLNYSTAERQYIRCTYDTCGNTTIYQGGTSLGNSTDYYNNIYAVNLYAKNTTVTGFDLAENYYVDDTSIAAGDIVAVDHGTTVKKSAGAYDKSVIGVVSTKPGLTLSEWEKDSRTRPVALSGRVPVKVTGDIAIGDYITSSDLPVFG